MPDTLYSSDASPTPPRKQPCAREAFGAPANASATRLPIDRNDLDGESLWLVIGIDLINVAVDELSDLCSEEIGHVHRLKELSRQVDHLTFLLVQIERHSKAIRALVEA